VSTASFDAARVAGSRPLGKLAAMNCRGPGPFGDDGGGGVAPLTAGGTFMSFGPSCHI
jgi:hypothetical protein